MSTPTPRPRATVATIPAYVPGKPPAPREGLRTYKLSSNENPYPPLPGVLEAVAAAAGQMNRYPDLGCAVLYDALATKLDVAPGRIAAATGSVAVLYHLIQAYCDPGDQVVYAWRSFEAYPIAAAIVGAESVQVPLAAGARHDLEAMADAITAGTKVVLLCTPNNPTGPALTDAAVRAFLDRVPGDVLVVIDEAYREFVRLDDPVDALTLVRERPNVVLMRTFAKAYGLAGLRVGYLVGSEEVATAVRACALPFGVSTIAQVAAVASLGAEAELLQRVDALVEERARVVAALRSHGWDLPDAQGNFVWFPLGERATEFAAAAEQAGVMVRPFAGDGVRVTVGESEANDRLVEVAAGFTA